MTKNSKSYMKDYMQEYGKNNNKQTLSISYLKWHTNIVSVINEFKQLYPEYNKHKQYKLFWTRKILPIIKTIKVRQRKNINKKTNKIISTEIEYTFDE